jgi:hypothetical protein
LSEKTNPSPEDAKKWWKTKPIGWLYWLLTVSFGLISVWISIQISPHNLNYWFLSVVYFLPFLVGYYAAAYVTFKLRKKP